MKEKILNHYTRGKIHGYITANPGEHYNSIKEALALSNGILAYHLNVLEREGYIKSMPDGMYRRFYPKSMSLPTNGHKKMQEIIANIIKEKPGISQKEIAKIVGLSTATVSYHIQILVSIRKVRIERTWRKNMCYLVDEKIES
ncbi:MAG: winged helix-turn-helix transcriptional regulator [Candidatus Thermoplasmatota archaeon]